MNTTFASRAEPAPRTAATPRILVWDVPVRVFHGLMVLCFVGAYLTAETERWRLLHVTLGYTVAGLIAFRIVWGLVGSRYARFSNFVRGPAAVWRYLRALKSPRPEHHTGHNPAGALAIVAMLGLGLLITASGWAVYHEVGPEWLEEAHELAGNAMLAVAVAHIVGVLLASRMHHENLVGAMVTGRKAGRPDEAIRSARRTVAALMLVAVLGFWAWQWQGAPAAGADGVAAVDGPTASAPSARRDKDDD